MTSDCDTVLLDDAAIRRLSEQYIDVAMFGESLRSFITSRRLTSSSFISPARIRIRKITSASILFLVNRYVSLVYGVILVLADNVDTNMVRFVSVLNRGTSTDV